MDAARIFLIEDDKPLRDELSRVLSVQGFTVTCCEDFPEATATALAGAFDCVLLDLTLPETSGHEICRAIRAKSAVPIIVITSSDQEFDEVMALGLGADDYLIKPFSPAVLIAHVQAVLRRVQTPASLSHGGLTVDEARAQIAYRGKTAELTRNELRLLALLIAQPGVVLSRQELMYALWESDEFIDDNTLTVNLNRLRRTLSSLGVPDGYIVTRRGLGYQIAADPESL